MNVGGYGCDAARNSRAVFGGGRKHRSDEGDGFGGSGRYGIRLPGGPQQQTTVCEMVQVCWDMDFTQARVQETCGMYQNCWGMEFTQVQVQRRSVEWFKVAGTGNIGTVPTQLRVQEISGIGQVCWAVEFSQVQVQEIFGTVQVYWNM
jgi:hypothetical protein